MKRPGYLAASLGVAFFLVPLYPSFIVLRGAPVPGVSLVPPLLALALFALASVIVVYWSVVLMAVTRRPLPTLLPLAAFPAAAAFSALLGSNPLAGVLFIVILIYGVIAHAMILRFARLPSVVPAILTAYLLSGLLASLLAIATALARSPANLYTIGHGRATGTFVLPGELAGYLILFVPVALALTRPNFGVQALAWPALITGSIAFVLTFSRAGWVGMAAALIAFVLLRRGRAGTRAALGIAAAAIVVLGLVFNEHHDPSENFTRLPIWESALQMAALFPLSGVGPFEFARLYPLFRVPGGEPAAYHAHSVILTIAAETGLVGLGALFFGWWRFVRALRARLSSRAKYGVVAAAIAAGLAGTWVQGLIDTISLVIFGLWLPFMALALACAGHEPAVDLDRVMPPPTSGVLALAAVVIALVCASFQMASSALFSWAAAPFSLPRHVPHEFGVRFYDGLSRVVPLPLFAEMLTSDALNRRDLREAEKYAARIPAGALASERRGQVALELGNLDQATQFFLDAGDDEALQQLVAVRQFQAGPTAAHALETRIRDRLAAAGTRPNALADSWWRLGTIATQLGNVREAADDYDHAIALAPLNTKYLKDAGKLAFTRGERRRAETLFTRAREIDPSDAIAVYYLRRLHPIPAVSP